jgi:hypothetical protein
VAELCGHRLRVPDLVAQRALFLEQDEAAPALVDDPRPVQPGLHGLGYVAWYFPELCDGRQQGRGVALALQEAGHQCR